VLLTQAQLQALHTLLESTKYLLLLLAVAEVVVPVLKPKALEAQALS
jgi:hypothetical protein